MAPPTFVQEAETVFNTAGSPKTGTITSDAISDVLVALGVAEDGSVTSLTPTLTGETFTSQGNTGTSGGSCRAHLSTAVIASAGASDVVSITRAGTSTLWWGANVLQFTNTGGVGGAASNNSTTVSAANLSLTTTQANSAIAIAVADYNSSDPTTWTWQTVNGALPTVQTSFLDSAHYSLAIAWWADAGAAGAKTIGVTQSFKWAIAAVEVKGGAGAAVRPHQPRAGNTAVMRAATWMKRSRRGILVPDLWLPNPVGA